MKTITFIGPFTDEGVALLMEGLRTCERKQPEEKFLMTIEDNVKERFPAITGQPVTFETFKREQ